ncbi:MAG: hypothetical protein ACYDGR_12775 [Candidatus Dormibacteria bacterium]
MNDATKNRRAMLPCPSCEAPLQVVSKTYHDVEMSTGMIRSAEIGTRYDLICTSGHALGGDYVFAPTPESIVGAVADAAGCELSRVAIPEAA